MLFLETEPFETAYGVTGMVRERRAAAAPEHTRGKVAGTVLCILSAVPLFIAVCLNGPDLLWCCGGLSAARICGSRQCVVCLWRRVSGGDGPGCSKRATSPARKRQNGVGAISSIYWLTVTAAYLLWTFGRGGMRSRRIRGFFGRLRACSMARSWRSCVCSGNNALM